MKWALRIALVGMACAALVALLTPTASAQRRKDHPYRYSVVDIPVSLGVGTVRTPGFSVPTGWYWIMVQVKKFLPFQQMTCMIGVTAGPLDSKNCRSTDPLLQADWTVWEESHLVSKGSSTTKADAKFDNRYIFKFLGSFGGDAGRKYVLEVKFTKDGTPLNAADPHLIVTKQGNE